MPRGLVLLVAALTLAGVGCAGRIPATSAGATPQAQPGSAPQPSPKASPPAPAAPAPRVAGTEGSSSQAVPVAGTPKAAPVVAPPATTSGYVFAPQQAVSAPPPPSQPAPADAAPELPGGELRLVLFASAAEVGTGEIVTVDVLAASSTAVVDAPLHLTFDPNVVEFVDAAPGDFLTQGGSSVVFLADGRSRPGDVALAVGRVTRERGASGSGLLCRVRFRGLGAGASPILVAQAFAWDTTGAVLAVSSTGVSVAVR